MLELAGYYDGASVQFLESVPSIKKNQRLKIIVTNDFVDEEKISLTNDALDEKHIRRERARRAYERLLSYAKPGIGSGDYKKDLAEMLEKKYEAID